MNRTLTIDPSGNGTTGYFLIDGDRKEFFEIKTTIFWQQITMLYELVKKHQPTNIIYEYTNYISNKTSSMTSLFKLFGVIESLPLTFDFVKGMDSIQVARIKALRKRIIAGKERINGISFKNGVG
jgi:tRNA U34 5-carboxymethylaminomethyl modifying enzyme MnmG/GidA